MKLTPTEQLYFDKLKDSIDGLQTEELVGLQVNPSRISNLVAANIKNLRRKLPAGYKIVSVRGWGYRLEKV